MEFPPVLTICLRIAAATALSQLFWYGLMAASVWTLFFLVFRDWMGRRRIGRHDPTARQIARELFYSLRSLAIFGIVTTFVVYAAIRGWTRLYESSGRYGSTWFVSSILIMIVIHDAYFYWTHRLMHHRRLYRWVHHTHHLSATPTPWAAYAFSPIEALVQAGIGPLIVFTIPVHPAAFALFMIWQISFNVFGHSGHEIFPHWFVNSPLFRVLNTVTHHSLHHEKPRTNFGLYFNLWDRLMGTNDADYDRRFTLATSPRRSDVE